MQFNTNINFLAPSQRLDPLLLVVCGYVNIHNACNNILPYKLSLTLSFWTYNND